MEKVTITTFTDPMMGLSYESEPVFRKLETRYGDRIELRYVMAGLVRDVSDFMTPEERLETQQDPERGIRRYCRRLAQIYKEEESIGGLPIHMESFHLFDAEHRSSWPLNIAFEAVKSTAPEKAEAFLYNLRYATIAETRQTTKEEEILQVARKTGVDEESFLKALQDGSAEAAFQKDLEYTRSLGVYGLPAYLVQNGDQAILIRSLAGYEAFSEAIAKLTGNAVIPQEADLSEDSLWALFQKHPLISKMELEAAFGITEAALEEAIRRAIESGRIQRRGEFYQVAQSFPYRD